LYLKYTINNIKTDTPINIKVLSIGKPGGGGVGGGGKLLVPFSMIIVILFNIVYFYCKYKNLNLKKKKKCYKIINSE
jgi:hypothetical protein